jgi:hypothetical protein
MIEGYADDPARADSDGPQASVNFNEFNAFFSSVANLGLELKIFNPHSINTTALSRFREANLFTFAGNGDGYMDLREATMMLASVFSAKRLSLRLYNAISSQCPTGELDEYNYALIDSACAREQVLQNYVTYFPHMPNMVKFLNGLSKDGRKSFFADVESASRSTPDVGWTDSDVIDHYAAIMQYIETVYLRFDLSGDGALTPKEADYAFPVFKNTLGNMAKCQGKDLNSGELKTVFTYLLANGKMPKNIWAFLGWWLDQHLALSGEFHSDRSRLVKIFAALSSSSTGPSNNPACQEP